MTEAVAHVVDDGRAAAADATLPAPCDTRVPPLAVGTVVWLASEVMFFAGLFGAYFVLRDHNRAAWPPDGVHLETGSAAAFTLVLIASSVTMQLAERAVTHGRVRAFRGWTLVTLAAGTLFVANQAREWRNLGFGAGSHPFGSAFYMLTGFHGAHVIAGLLAMLFVLARSGRPGFGHDDSGSVRAISAYWHFVDAVWLIVFAVVFVA